MMAAGMDIARLNFSHGNHVEHGSRIEMIREAARLEQKIVGIMLDTKGPEIRTGMLPDGKKTLFPGEMVHLIYGTHGTAEAIAIDYPYLVEDVNPGDTFFIDDGKLNLCVEAVNADNLLCRVVVGGELKERKGVNIPGVSVRLPALTDRDIDDLRFGCSQGVDFIAASFIRRPADVLDIRRILEEEGSDAHIIAKIEHSDAVNNLEGIIAVANGIMVARGDLGVELPTEEVPLVQKQIIRLCNHVGCPVITATQMLESMVGNPRPTRAEASDVANAIFDGTDATMLSGETAAGAYPVEAVATMARLAARTDSARQATPPRHDFPPDLEITISDAISFATCQAAQVLAAAAIITPTEAGSTARTVAKYRPRVPIVAASPNQRALRKLTLVWGVTPVLVDRTDNTDTLIEQAVQAGLAAGVIHKGDMTLITAGVPFGVPGTTNLMKVHIVSEVLCHGQGVGRGHAQGKVRFVRDACDIAKVCAGDVVFTLSLDEGLAAAAAKAVGIVAVEGGMTSAAAIAALTYSIPAVVGVDEALDVVREGEIVTIDATRGIIYRGLVNLGKSS
jgi:pyruvate kinase